MWERLGTQFLQRSVTISIRPTLVAQQTILPLMNVSIYLRAVLRINFKLGPVIAPDRHSNCSPFFPSPPSFPFRFPSPFSFPFRGLRPSRQTQLAGLGERCELSQRVWPNAFWCILVKKSSHLGCLGLQYFGVSLY